MPAINPNGSGNSAPPQRTTFRPPWVKDGPEPLPLPTAPWTLARTRDQKKDVAIAVLKPSTVKLRAASIENDGAPSSSTGGRAATGKPDVEKEKSPKAEPAPVRKQSKITIVPSMPTGKPAAKENGHQAAAEVSKPREEEPKPEPVSKRKLSQERKNKSIDSESKLKAQKSVDASNASTGMPIEIKSVKTAAPAAPPLPPPPPPQGPKKGAPLSAAKAEKLEALRSRPRKRPDWGTLMKDIESVRKLNHVQCNDRSSPLLPKVKVKEGFMYESEKATVHNQLLKEIQFGVPLKRVQTNDRSKPILEGLRKFRRQLTIEEQIQKATEAEVVEVEPDELDDIDKVRDDLQSTKQMLALELRNKEAAGRENKRLQAKILHLESELEREKVSNKQTDKTPDVINKKHEQDIRALNSKLQDQEKHAKEMENMYHDVVSQLDLTKNELEDALKKAKMLENKLALQAKGGESHQLMKQPSSKKIPQNKDAKETNNVDENNAIDGESEYEEVTETEEEEEENGESSEDSETDKAALQEKRTARELKLLTTKLKALKDKEVIARKERRSLRDQLKKEQKALREEKKKYKELQKEVDKMANLMKDDEEEEEAEDKSGTEEESESESESESEESEDEESDGELPPDAPADDKKMNFSERAKKHENFLTVLKKGNYMLKANIDRLKDELFKQKEMSITLQEDLNSVLAELG